MTEDPIVPHTSGSLQKSEFYRVLAAHAGDRLEVAASKVDRHREREVNERLRSLARDAYELASEFERWAVRDPGPDARLRATTRLMELRAAVEAAEHGRHV